MLQLPSPRVPALDLQHAGSYYPMYSPQWQVQVVEY